MFESVHLRLVSQTSPRSSHLALSSFSYRIKDISIYCVLIYFYFSCFLFTQYKMFWRKKDIKIQREYFIQFCVIFRTR